jgi:hypothetical protein
LAGSSFVLADNANQHFLFSPTLSLSRNSQAMICLMTLHHLEKDLQKSARGTDRLLMIGFVDDKWTIEQMKRDRFKGILLWHSFSRLRNPNVLKKAHIDEF